MEEKTTKKNKAGMARQRVPFMCNQTVPFRGNSQRQKIDKFIPANDNHKAFLATIASFLK